MPSQHMAPYANGFNGGQQSHPNAGDGSNPNSAEEDLIMTAIVIKNIPFAVKKEALQQMMNEMGLPIPYAFNYHFDNGVFRGLAFANFSTAEDTAQIIEALNHFDLQGRKLRVEYKKMLPAEERDRIEREKRERRGQLEEQHRPQLLPQTSLSSLNSQMLPRTSPSPVSTRGQNSSNPLAGEPTPSLDQT
jgi:RNA recognition motif-containing protein